MNNSRRAIPVKRGWKATEKPEQTTCQGGDRKGAEKEERRKGKNAEIS